MVGLTPELDVQDHPAEVPGVPSVDAADGVANAPVRTYRAEVRDGMIYVGTKPQP